MLLRDVRAPLAAALFGGGDEDDVSTVAWKTRWRLHWHVVDNLDQECASVLASNDSTSAVWGHHRGPCGYPTDPLAARVRQHQKE